MTSLLNAIIDFPLLKEGYYIHLNWIGKFARWIIEGVGSIGLGIILFTVVLKAITLPFDIYQRVKMRKQNLLMKQMQPELEKLQKQYANDKTMYNQKMMELYKKNGYSMFSACLPTILSLVILIVAFQGFRYYSNYANLKMYAEMSSAYNGALQEYIIDGKNYHLPVEGADADELTVAWEENKTWTEGTVVYTMQTVMNERVLTVSSTESTKFIGYSYFLDANKVDRKYQLDTDKLYASGVSVSGKTAKTFIDESVAAQREKAEKEEKTFSEEDSFRLACHEFTVKVGALAARDWYLSHNSSFLWVKNVWYPDVSYNHPIQDYAALTKSLNNPNVEYGDGTTEALSKALPTASYNDLISELTDYTHKANGYFILIVLSIGLMLLSQFISMRSSKETNQYQTVDGSGASTQKMMLIMMPIIYAVFAFMYSAAFSIYMTMSSLIAVIVTLLSNFFIGRAFRKKEEAEFVAKNTRILPWMKQDDDGKKGKKKK